MDINACKLDLYPRTAVIGLGGAGCSIAKKFMESLAPTDIIAIDTDADSLRFAVADYKLPIGNGSAGYSDKKDGTSQAVCSSSDLEKISEILKRYDIITIVAGMGGKTGTDTAPVIAEIADRIGVLSMAVAVRPLSSENKDGIAKAGIAKLKSVCSSTVSVYNDKIKLLYPGVPLSEIFNKVNAEVEIFVRKKMRMASDLLMSEIMKAMLSRSGQENAAGRRVNTTFA